MRRRVVLEFGGRKEVKPTFGVIGTEDTEICLDFLVGVLCLSIGLRVVGCGKFDVILEESGQFSGECRGELRSPIRYHGVM